MRIGLVKCVEEVKEGEKLIVDAQRQLHLIMKDVVKKALLKWLDADIVYAIPDSDGLTMVANEKNKFIPTQTMKG
ncbi:RNA-directed DNA polymerase-like protein [Gossypium australe]|uniref:RNA-directed DNA polymerase-like protein n=1 Tax=Gossypium australe TaxID=47621 RepID=A0A5B6VC53_9ROSI|nr:RNA-directed DNA polymerase-like protein [Gossypium australe]